MPNYIDNEEFIKLILVYKKTRNKVVYNEIGKNLLAIVNNQLRLPCFINYTDDRKSEMISDALYYMTRSIDRYNPMYASGNALEGNPFSYFTMIAQRAFLQRLAYYKRMDAIFKPISYIDNIEGIAYRKSTIFKNHVDPQVE